MKTSIVFYFFTLTILIGCSNKPSTSELLEKSFASLNDSLKAAGYVFHQNIEPTYFPYSISESKITGDTEFLRYGASDTIFSPKSLKIKGNKYKKDGLAIEYYQLYFADKSEETNFNQFIPFSQFLLANQKTRGIYFMHDEFLYLEYHPFP